MIIARYNRLSLSSWYRHRIFSFFLVLLISMALSNTDFAQAETATPQSIPMINFTAGHLGIVDDQKDPLRFGLEYRFRPFSPWKLIPAVGFAFAENGAYFAYSGLRYDFMMTRHWMLVPSFGVGFFKESSKLKLGNELEFRSGLELAYHFDNHYRMGLVLFHLSNSSLGDVNPGTEVLVLSFTFPIKY